MKKFETPAIDVLKMAVCDVIATSNGGSVSGDGNFGGAEED